MRQPSRAGLDGPEPEPLQRDEDQRIGRRGGIQPGAAAKERRIGQRAGFQGFLNAPGPQDLGDHGGIVDFQPIEHKCLSGYDGFMEWRAGHILVKNRKLADELLRRIKQGGSFEALAREHSTCPSKSRGGDLGWFGPGKMVAAFESACKRMSPGSTSDIVSTSFGYHIIRLTGRKD